MVCLHFRLSHPANLQIGQPWSNVYDTNMMTEDPGTKHSKLTAIHLGLLFAVLYFVQGLAEPGEGLIAQPVRSLLNGWVAGCQNTADMNSAS